MESHPLNLAHQQHRRAEAHLKNNRYDEAIQCHHNAAELLLDAMKLTTSSVALESITLQHSYHLKQKDLIKNKKEQYVRVIKALENIKCLSNDPKYLLQGNDVTKLQVTICKALNKSDNLLNVLNTKIQSIEKATVKVIDVSDEVDGNMVKSQGNIVEELQTVNHDLNTTMEQLLVHVEVLKDDNAILKERINYLEKERTKYLNIQSQDDSMERNDFSALSLLSDGFVKDFNSKDSTLTKPFNINAFN